jgi:chitin synthase
MRFVVFIDLFGTLILPATVIYLGYLIYLVASGTGQFPLIAIIMLASIYGLQAIIFILKRRWQHIGWMIVYLLAYPIYGFALPVYSFWHMDDFAWGNTRVVVGEKGGKKIIASSEEEKFSDRIIPKKRWEQHATERGLPLGPEMVIVDTSGAVFVEQYPVPNTIAQWQQEARASYMPGQSQVGGRQSPFIPQYAPSMNGPPPQRAWVQQTMEMDDFTNGRQMSMAQSQINLSTRIPRGSFANSTRSRFVGSENGYLAPQIVSRPSTATGNQFADFDSHSSESQDESLAREVVRNVLKEVDINTTTTKQVRALVEAKLGLGLHAPVNPDQRKALDDMIDQELEEMI